MFITSSDDHDVHDVLMITYIVLNIPWMFGSLSCTPTSHTAARRRRSVHGSDVKILLSFESMANVFTGDGLPLRAFQNYFGDFRKSLNLILRFFASIAPMVYYFIQHKVHRIPGGEYIFIYSVQLH